MKPIPQIIIPAGLDLGDIANVKVGDEITTLGTLTGSPVVGAGVHRVSEITKDGLVRVGRTGSFWLKHGGGAYYFMYSGVFFYSVNPAHIAEAKKKADINRAEREREAAEREKIMAIASPIGFALGDGDRDDGDGGHWQCTDAADTIAQKLSMDQMMQLAKWLGVEIDGN